MNTISIYTRLIVMIFTLVMTHLAGAEDQPDTHFQIKQSVERSIPYIEKNGVTWMEEKKCSSCHQVPSMLWSLQSANRFGLYPQKNKLDEWAAWTETKIQEQHDDPNVNPPLDTMVQLMMSQTNALNLDINSYPYKQFPDYILELQLEDGSWNPDGQLPGQKRDGQESFSASTKWAVLALLTYKPDNSSVTESIKKALHRLDQCKPGESNEWLVISILLEQKLLNIEKVNTLLHTLLSLQNDDGGWGWDANRPSDALATGQSLYALSITGSELSQDAVKKGVTFLLKTQNANGEWIVPSTLTRENDKPMPTSNYWGTSWAVIGLLNTLPDDAVIKDTVLMNKQ